MLVANLFLVIGFCLGTVGAAGFGPETQDLAWPFLIAGSGLMVVGAFLRRRALKGLVDTQSVGQGSMEKLQAGLTSVQNQMQALCLEMDSMQEVDFRSRLDSVLEETVFDLTKDSEDYLSEFGFAQYARVWDGIAVGERLLARAWSMATDGHIAEAREEVRLSLAEFSRASATLG